MEYCENKSLNEVIYNYELQIKRADFCDWGRQIASGMVYLHEQNIIHRNLKPSKYALFSAVSSLTVFAALLILFFTVLVFLLETKTY